MSELSQALLNLFDSESLSEFQEALGLLENAVFKADVIGVSLLLDSIPQLTEEWPELSQDLAEFQEFIEVLTETEAVPDLPQFLQTKDLVLARERHSEVIQRKIDAMGDSLRRPLSRLARISEKKRWTEEFLKMRTIHQWFMNAITEYVEVVEYTSKEERPSVRSRPSEMNTSVLTKALRQSRTVLQGTLRPWFRIWSYWTNSKGLLEQPLLPKTSQKWKWLVSCLSLNKTRPSYTGNNLAYLNLQ